MPQSKPNPALKQLNALVGEWKLQASLGGQPAGRARTAFEWLEGRAFLAYWEKSSDGSTWEPDFDLRYTKVL